MNLKNFGTGTRGKQCIGVVTFPVTESGLVPLRNLVDILHPLASRLCLITGGAGGEFFKRAGKPYTYVVEHKGGARAVFTRVINYVWTQSKISYRLLRLRRHVGLWFFFIGAGGLILPVLTAKCLKSKVIIVRAGSGPRVAQAQRDPLVQVLTVLQSVTYHLSDRILVYSGRVLKDHELMRYTSKSRVAHRHFLDFNVFRIKKRWDERDACVGYIGTLSRAKGVGNLINAIPKVLEERGDLQFVVVGQGELYNEIEAYLQNRGLSNKVRLQGWIPHDEVPNCLNNLKLLVLPSHTEGLPNILLEAMACGTLVLATPVGAIPDVLRDGETGFLMRDNSPGHIAESIVKVLSQPNLGEVIQNACAMVEKEFTYAKAVESYRKVLDDL